MKTFSAFSGAQRIAQGSLLEVAEKVKKWAQAEPSASFLIFDDLTSAQVELDLRGSLESVLKRVKPDEVEEVDEKKAGPGRPKLGVISREITLLPQHWEWLGSQPGGASITLRKLVEEAKKKNFAKDQIRHAQESTYNFMTVMAGDLPGFEEALRSLYAKQEESFLKWIKAWPKDIRSHVLKLAKPAF